MLSSLTDKVRELLSSAEADTIIVTIGNSLRSDDGAGPYIAKNCATVIDAGEKPENIIEEIVSKHPEKVIIIDAANFGGKIGEARVIPIEKVAETTLSTHMFPIPAIAKIIETDTKAKVYFIGIQGKSFELGEGLSSETKQTCAEIIRRINHA